MIIANAISMIAETKYILHILTPLLTSLVYYVCEMWRKDKKNRTQSISILAIILSVVPCRRHTQKGMNIVVQIGYSVLLWLQYNCSVGWQISALNQPIILDIGFLKEDGHIRFGKKLLIRIIVLIMNNQGHILCISRIILDIIIQKRRF